MSERFALWDLPTRLFHWAIVILLPAAWWTAEEENYDAHQWIGYTVLVLVLFRLAWGFVGSRHSRFADFLVGPAGVAGYLRSGASPSPGHNPLGGWSVVALLLLLLSQAVSGLFNTDEVFYSAPLYYWAPGWLRDAMGAWHDYGFNLLLAMVCLHLLAVCYYQFRQREPLVQAMVKGHAAGREGLAGSAPLWRALVVVAIAALLLWGVLSQAPQPQSSWF